jgi:Predicted membrane protein (DUF2306)
MSPQTADLAPVSREQRAPLWLRVGFLGCTGIAVGVVLRRILALLNPPHAAPPQLAGLDAFFASHAAHTLAHILPALAFVLVAAVVVLRPEKQSDWPGAIIYPLGAVVGFTAYAMSIDSVGGWTERSAVLLFNSLFLVSLFRAWRFRRGADTPLERRWLLRAIAILLGIATTRPVMGVFFATSPLTHLKPQQFFGIAFWIGFSINAVIFESWIRSRSRTGSARLRERFHR